MIRIVGAVSDLQQPPCPDFSRRRYSIDQIEIYIPFVPIYDQQFDFSPQLTPFVPINGTSHDYPIWRLSEYHSDNLGLAFTDGGLLLGRIPLIERRDGRFVVRERSEIARLVKYSFPNGVAIDRLLPGLTIVASALNANNQAGARIAAVHLQIPNLPSLAARDAMIAEDALIKYARDGGGAGDWNPELHPRTGTPPNSGWFATTGGHREEPGQDESSTANQGCASPQTKMAQGARTSRHRRTISKHCSQAIRSMSQQISPIGPTGTISGPTLGRRSKIGWRSR
jgi:hypothetical protein